jgi:hypothetical protein
MPAGYPLPPQEDWQTPELLNGWVNPDTQAAPAGYWKDSFGVVRLRGYLNGGAYYVPCLVLPVGYRPAYYEEIFCPAAGYQGLVFLYPDGAIVVAENPTNKINLSAITFRAV